MKNTGIVRKFDKLGRIVIPKEIRNLYNTEELKYSFHKDRGMIILTANDITSKLVSRKVDPIGRLSIPKEMRLAIGAEFGKVQFFVKKNGSIALKQFEQSCSFCLESDYSKLENYKDKLICKDCIKNIKRIL